MVTPRLARSFGVLNRFFNELAYDPPGAASRSTSGRLGRARRRHDVQPPGPARTDPRGLVLVTCNGYDVLEQVILGNPQLGLLTRLLNLPPERTPVPTTSPPDDRMP